ncbi:phosphate acyltransferase PlsX [Xylanibacillus composti]|uniref:Phosphate acyltransferase n=1 Tax=Xylanibacillus composti TaxID=1572762 RepID=A0A8J4H0L3_9BACL|nr:phosphate acyltransferase PlsX [Xylanibacillus composti]MDT9724134.1 phosphate acyltransferase PlsX [Xylanibacillus composti]GIQ68684.1 phosphate acyltransferase [Xylanibacillus composti]
MRIAIDAMGGDHAPHSNVEGALRAAKEWPDTRIILVGDERQLAPLAGGAPSNVEILHASEVIGPEDEPVKAVRRKKDSSMVVAGRLVKEGGAEAMISAGNTGALMTTGLLVLGRIPGIDRPGLATMLPTLDGKGVLALDLGANMDASPEHLLQYARMGSLYRKSLEGLDSPRVGLLNVGTEAGKGNELTKEAYPLLEELPIRFVGNVEARDVMDGACDVLICDGFAGNILLKAMEGTAGAVFGALKSAFTRTAVSKLAAAVLAPGLREFKKKLDYTEHGGAPLLGVAGVCIKGHGSSDAHAIKNAVRQARLTIQSELVPRLSKEISGK